MEEATETVVRMCLAIVSVSLVFTATHIAGRQGGYSSGNDKSKVCHHYLRGTCAFGDRCKFAHVSQQSTGPTYARYGQQHVSQQSTGPIYAQYGRQQQPRVCEHYLNGTCRYGDRCKFEHPSSRWSSGSHTQGISDSVLLGSMWPCPLLS